MFMHVLYSGHSSLTTILLHAQVKAVYPNLGMLSSAVACMCSPSGEWGNCCPTPQLIACENKQSDVLKSNPPDLCHQREHQGTGIHIRSSGPAEIGGFI